MIPMEVWRMKGAYEDSRIDVCSMYELVMLILDIRKFNVCILCVKEMIVYVCTECICNFDFSIIFRMSILALCAVTVGRAWRGKPVSLNGISDSISWGRPITASWRFSFKLKGCSTTVSVKTFLLRSCSWQQCSAFEGPVLSTDRFSSKSDGAPTTASVQMMNTDTWRGRNISRAAWLSGCSYGDSWNCWKPVLPKLRTVIPQTETLCLRDRIRHLSVQGRAE